MNVKTVKSITQPSPNHLDNPDVFGTDTQRLIDLLLEEMRSALYGSKSLGENNGGSGSGLKALPSRAQVVAKRIAQEVQRICRKSDLNFESVIPG